DLKDALEDLKKCTLTQWDQARAFTQHIEDHESDSYKLLATKEDCGDPETVVKRAVERLDTILQKESGGNDNAAEVATTAGTLLPPERREELDAILRRIKQFERLLVDSAATTRRITEGRFETTDVADFFVVRQGSIVVEWTKERRRTLTIVKASPFEKLSTNHPDSVTTSYGAASLTASLVDLNVALTYTPLSSPVFGMVSEPAPTAAEPGATQTVIRQTDEDSRSGECALLLSLPVFLPMGDSPAARRFALVLGTGASSSNPALFLGLSAKLYGGVQVSAGVTRQQVKALDGQSVGDPIAAATDIRLGNHWDTQFFASVSLSLRGIGSLFGSP
ncbi:MAG: hypothetical protein H6Q03_1659, partial [Acidobacteria bacterium]|nr:hypothetical protein [Acidobacteriota bacterium]